MDHVKDNEEKSFSHITNSAVSNRDTNFMNDNSQYLVNSKKEIIDRHSFNLKSNNEVSFTSSKSKKFSSNNVDL